MKIPFHKPYRTKKELYYIKEVLDSGKVGADGHFTKKNKEILSCLLDTNNLLLTTSCTHAIEMALQLIELEENDEVIMPTFTFPSTANAVMLNKGKVVFTEINHRDLCMDPNKIEEKITDKTKAIIVVHYGGNACDMDAIMAIANKYHLYVIEDTAQGFLSTYKKKPLGTIGHFGCFSFHGTKNITSGEGGALSINLEDVSLLNRAEYIRQKGTNRLDYDKGIVDHYEWVDVGSSYCPSDILMAYLFAQLEAINEIQNKRSRIFNIYHDLFIQHDFDKIQWFSHGNSDGVFNAHIFYVIFKESQVAKEFKEQLERQGITVYTHFVPLHGSEMGKKIGYSIDDFPYENHLYNCLLRLPIYASLTNEELEYIINNMYDILKGYET